MKKIALTFLVVALSSLVSGIFIALGGELTLIRASAAIFCCAMAAAAAILSKKIGG